MKHIKRVLSFALILTLLLIQTVPSSAENNSPSKTPSLKEEVIYGILNLDGSVDNLYAVNVFDGGEIIDYGRYSEVRNLTTSEKINVNDDEITISTEAERFYYQGTLENRELPWDIAIKYFLDGEEISGQDLGGKSGALRIEMSVKRNKKVNSIFFDNYALQVTFSLDSRLCTGIKAENATIAEAGSKKQLAYTILPGNDANIVVEADVRDFEMDPVTINGIRLALNLNVDSSAFSEQISELAKAVKSLDDGASELLNGVSSLSDGMQKYINGLKAFRDGLVQLSAGTDKLDAGASQIKQGLSELAKQNDSLMAGALAIQQAVFDTVNSRLAGFGLPSLTPENYGAVLSSVPGLETVKTQLDGVIQFTQGLKSYLDGVAKLDDGASQLVSGISEFKNSASTITAAANELYDGGAELNAAVKKLRDGLASYRAGTRKLKEGTTGMDSEIDKKINEILSGIFGENKTASFVSEKNTNVSAVQFVLKTKPVNAPEIPKTPNEQPAKLNFWQKLLKLFGLL